MNNTIQIPIDTKLPFLNTEALQLRQAPAISDDIDPEHKKIILSVFLRPEMPSLIRSVEFKVSEKMSLPFRVPSANEIELNPRILKCPSLAAFFLRHALEIAIWQRKMSGYVPLSFFLAVAVLSANTAKLYWESMLEREQRLLLDHMPEEFQGFFDSVRKLVLLNLTKLRNIGESRILLRKLLKIQDMEDIQNNALSEDILNEAAYFVKQGSFIAAPSEYLLIQGGDCRLKIDKASGLNGYGCSPKPRPWAVTFSSSTATSISDYAFDQVEMTRQKMMKAVYRDNIEDQYAYEVESIRARIVEVFGLCELKNVEVVLTSSGTDAELFALFLSGCGEKAPVTNILVGPEETGSGVPLAAEGRHFTADTPLGSTIKKGELIEGLPVDGVRLLSVPLRNSDGTFLSLKSIDSRVKTLASKAIMAGHRVLIHMVESSKTGLSAPSLNAVRDLKDRYGRAMDVLVDACQLRTGRTRLKRYLEAGFMVSVTGSKFYTGPPFSGALLIPTEIAQRVKDGESIPAGFSSYLTRYDLPQRIQNAKSPVWEQKNIGLMLRWNAALKEIAAFQVLSEKHKYLILAIFGESIRESIAANPDLELVTSPIMERWNLPDGEEWDWLPSIFTFTISRPGTRGTRNPVYFGDTKKIYYWLNMDISKFLPEETSEEEKCVAGKRCHIGQPLKIALAGGRWIGALRISAGARLISGVCSDPGLGRHFAERLSNEIGDACRALDKISIIIKYWDYIEHNNVLADTANDQYDPENAFVI